MIIKKNRLIRGALAVLMAQGLAFVVPAALAASTVRDTLNFEIEIQPAFFIETQSDQGNILLDPMVPNRPVSQDMRVFVRTNRGQPYQVVQILDRKPFSERGFYLEPGSIQFSVTDGVNGGRSQVKRPLPLMPGRAVLFTSNREGAADQFVITYGSMGDSVIPAGKYKAHILVEGELK